MDCICRSICRNTIELDINCPVHRPVHVIGTNEGAKSVGSVQAGKSNCPHCARPLPTLEEYVLSRMQEPGPEFRPTWYWNEIGQQIEVHWSGEPYYAEQLNEDMTLHYSQETPGKIVGVTIYGVQPQAKAVLAPPSERRDK